ncbi:PglL family O-oligosaccharyltransferase, partial [Solemya elarraichensis gill symbiont]
FIVIAIFARNGGRFRVSYSSLLVFAIAVIPMLQYLSGTILFFGDAFLSSVYLAGFAFAISAGRELDAEWTKTLLWALVLVAAFSVTVSTIHWLHIDFTAGGLMETPFQSTPSGNMGQRNHFATLTMMAVGALLYLNHVKRIGNVATVILLLFFVFGLALSKSRTPWLDAFILSLFVLLKYQYLETPRRLVVWLLMAVGFYLLILLWTFPVVTEVQTIPPLESFIRNEEGEVRPRIWTHLLNAVVVGDWGGYGWKQESVALALTSDQSWRTIDTTSSHNLFLSFLVWNGPVIGLLMIAAVMLWGWHHIWKCTTPEHFYLLCMIGAVAVHSQLEFPYEFAYFLVPVGILVGYSEQLMMSKTVSVSVPPIISIAITSCVLILMLLVQTEFAILKQANLKMHSINARIKKAELMVIPQGEIRFLNHLKAFIDLGNNKPREGMEEAELDEIHQVALRYPRHYVLFRYAVALGLNHHPEKASEILLVLRHMHGSDIYADYLDRWRSSAALHPQLNQVALPSLLISTSS